MSAGLLSGLLLVAGVGAQQFGDLQGTPARQQQREYVTYAAEPAVVASGKRAVVEVHLLVADGYHVNSHTPKSDLLIPTAAKLEAGDAGVRMEPVEYPRGVSYSFATDPGEVLDVYAGAVVLRVPVVAVGWGSCVEGDAAVPGLRSEGVLSAEDFVADGAVYGEVAAALRCSSIGATESGQEVGCVFSYPWERRDLSAARVALRSR